MSTNAVRTRPTLRIEHSNETYASSTPQLRVIEGAAPRRSRLPMLLAGLMVIVLAIGASMVFHTRMAQTAYAIREYQIELNALEAQAWTAQTQLRRMESAASLEEKARKMGMVPAKISGTITLSTGVVEGGVASH